MNDPLLYFHRGFFSIPVLDFQKNRNISFEFLIFEIAQAYLKISKMVKKKLVYTIYNEDRYEI